MMPNMTTWNRDEDRIEHGDIEEEGGATAAEVFGYCPSGDDIIVPQRRSVPQDDERRSPELDADEPGFEPPTDLDPNRDPKLDLGDIPF